MRDRKVFTMEPRRAQDLADVLCWSYPEFAQRGVTYEEFESDVRALPFGDDPRVTRALKWCREKCVCKTHSNARVYAHRANNVSNTTEDMRAGLKA